MIPKILLLFCAFGAVSLASGAGLRHHQPTNSSVEELHPNDLRASGGAYLESSDYGIARDGFKEVLKWGASLAGEAVAGPVGDKVLSFLMGKLFDLLAGKEEEEKPNVFGEIKDQVAGLVDGKILELETRQMFQTITGMRESMPRFKLLNKQEQGQKVTVLLTKCEDLFSAIVHHPNVASLFPLLVPLSHLHVGLLKMRYHFGHLWWRQAGGNAARDNQQRLDDLHYWLATYVRTVTSEYDKWEVWRTGKLTLVNSGGKLQLKDEIFGVNLIDEEGVDWKVWLLEKAKRYRMTYLKNYMIESISPIFSLHRLAPGHEEDPPYAADVKFTEYVIGPISPVSYGIGWDRRNGPANFVGGDVECDMSACPAGSRITNVIASAENLLYGLQITYHSGEVVTVGSLLREVKERQVNLPWEGSGTCLAAVQWYGNTFFSSMTGVQFVTRDWREFGPYGNKPTTPIPFGRSVGIWIKTPKDYCIEAIKACGSHGLSISGVSMVVRAQGFAETAPAALTRGMELLHAPGCGSGTCYSVNHA